MSSYIIKSKKIKGAVTLVIDKTIAVYVPKFQDLLKGNKLRVISSELNPETSKKLFTRKPKEGIEIKATILINRYKQGYVKVSIEYQKQTLVLSLVRADRIKGFGDSKSQWLIIRTKNKQATTESSNSKPVAVFIKGNPKYWIKGVSETFYNNIKNIIINAGYEYKEAESTIKSDQLPKGDVYLGFSRGCGYYRMFNKYHIHDKAPFIAIHCNKSRAPYKIVNPDDHTYKGDYSKESLKAHWTLTNKEAIQLSKILKNLHKNLSEISTMGAITPVAKVTTIEKYKK